LTRRLTPSRAVAAYLTARDETDRLKSAAAEALALAASAHTGQTWAALPPADGIAATDNGGYRVGWTDLNGSPMINASVRMGDVYVSAKAADVATALDLLCRVLGRGVVA